MTRTRTPKNTRNTPADPTPTPDTPDAVDTPTDPTPTPDTPDAVDTPTDTPADDTPDAVDTPTDPTPDLSPTDLFVERFVAAVAAVDTPDADTAWADAIAAYGALPGGARGGARGAGMAAAITAGHPGPVVVRLYEQVPTAAAARGTDTPDLIGLYRDRVSACIVAAGNIPRPDDAPSITDIIAAVSADGWTPSDTVTRVARDIVAAATRGTGRGTVDRLALSAMPDGDLSYTRKTATYRATLRGGVITTADGRVFTDTTPAAVHANGGTSVNGWTAWRYVGGTYTGRTLHAVSTDPAVIAAVTGDTGDTPDADTPDDTDTPDA